MDHLARRWGATWSRGDRAREATARHAGEPVALLTPQTYMNRSGQALAPFLGLPGFDPAADLLVLVDDVATDLGRFRLRGAGSAGGHNGLRSIEGALRRQDYARLRIGVGPRPPEADDLADFVLDAFSPDERDVLHGLLDPMADAVEAWVAHGIEKAMSWHNR